MKFPLLKREYRSLIDTSIFIVTLLAANALWKLSVSGEEYGKAVTWFGLDASLFFDVITRHVANVVFWIVSHLRSTAHFVNEYVILFDTGTSTAIVWGCAGVKQAFIYIILLLTTQRSWRDKWIYIPIGLVVCYLFNILRIVIITLVIEYHQEYFEFLHSYFFKFLYYGVMFLLWRHLVENSEPTFSERLLQTK